MVGLGLGPERDGSGTSEWPRTDPRGLNDPDSWCRETDRRVGSDPDRETGVEGPERLPPLGPPRQSEPPETPSRVPSPGTSSCPSR